MGILYNQGTVQATADSTVIQFTDANLLPVYANHGDEINIGGQFSAFIDSIDYSAQTAVIFPPFVGTSGAGKAFAIRRATPLSVSASEALERTTELLEQVSILLQTVELQING